MKKLIVCLVTIFAVLSFVGLTSVYAYPYIEVEGFANPTSFGTVTDNLDGTTTFSDVQYRFNVVTADFGAMVNKLNLEFESDVFKSLGSLSFNNPLDWSSSTMTSSSGSVYEIASAGTTIGAGQKLVFTMADVVVYNAALAGDALWQEGQMWGQSWDAYDTNGGHDGGSTALVPEPGTILLFGAGLVGLYYVRRTKVFNI